MNRSQLIVLPLLSIEAVPAPAVLHLTDFGREVPLAGYAWLHRAADVDRWTLIDTGTADTEAVNADRPPSRRWRASPVQEAMALHGVGIDDVSDVIVTHLHHDHCGAIETFPNAEWHVPAVEWEFVNDSANADLAPEPLYPHHIFQSMAHHGVCTLEDGDRPVAGLRMRHIGGHTIGCMTVEILNASGDVCVVLAGDIMPLYENLTRQIPPGTLWHLGECRRALKRLAEFDVPVLPGHDPKLMHEYPTGVIQYG